MPEKFRKSQVRNARFQWPDTWLDAIASLSGFRQQTPGKQADSVKQLSDFFLHGNIPASCGSFARNADWTDYGSDAALRAAYAAYFLTANVPKIVDSFESCQFDWRHISNILDIGTGPGTALLGSLFARGRAGIVSPVSLVALDSSRGFLSLAERLIRHFRHVCSLPGTDSFQYFSLGQSDIRRVSANTFSPCSTPLKNRPEILSGIRKSDLDMFDLVTAANVAAELPSSVAGTFHQRLHSWVRPGGYAFLMEPARREPARQLLGIRNRLIELGWTVLYPCPADYSCPMLHRKRDWCHHRLTWAIPEETTRIDRLTGMHKNLLNFTVFVLQKPTGERCCSFDSDLMSDTAGHDAEMSNGIRDVTCRVVSDVMRRKGRFEVCLCGYFSHNKHLLTAVLEKKHVSHYNSVFMDLARYDRIRLQNTIIRGERLIIQQESRLTLWVDDGDRE